MERGSGRGGVADNGGEGQGRGGRRGRGGGAGRGRGGRGGTGDRYPEQPRDNWRSKNQSGRGINDRSGGRNINQSGGGSNSESGGGSNSESGGGSNSQSGDRGDGRNQRGNIGRGGNQRGVRGRGRVDQSPSNSVVRSEEPSPNRELDWRAPSDSRAGMHVSNNATQLSPLQRPDKGGKMSIRNVILRANHFLVKFNPETVIFHYDVDVKPKDIAHGQTVKIPKAELAVIRKQMFSSDNRSEFPLSFTSYDGAKNIFSAVQLPVTNVTVTIPAENEGRTRSYSFTIKLVNELKLEKLTDYMRGRAASIPRDILQGMDVVMKENPNMEMISVGRNFYPKEPDSADDLGHGISAFQGFQHSLKPTHQGLSLCLDYSVLAFRKRLPVLEFLEKHIHKFTLDKFWNFQSAVKNVLGGLKVEVTHRKTRQKFVVKGLTRESASHYLIQPQDPEGVVSEKISLVQYFYDKYGKTIAHGNLPCLDLGKDKKINCVPIELCIIAEGQRFPKEDLDRDAAQHLKGLSLPRPSEREARIRRMIQSSTGPCGGGIAKNFDFDVDMNMTAVEARVIRPPELKLGTPTGRLITVSVDKEKCQWNLLGKFFVQGKPIERWVVLDFRLNDNRFGLDHHAFTQQLISRCFKLGIKMKAPLFNETTSMRKLDSVDVLYELLEGINERACKQSGGCLQLLVCIMARRDPGYKHLKWISETQIGIVTQCCLSTHVSKGSDQYLTNLVMKINAKLGGSNVELSRVSISAGPGHVMFVGADVNHPAAKNMSSPSIAAVVGTMNWPAANRYAARVRAQYHRCEKIIDFGDIVLDLVKSYASKNKVRPERLIIFRDGVSEGQFDMVLNEELLDLKRAFDSMEYSPTITLVVAQKRHLTRFFPVNTKDGSPTGNVSPGTVVDTKVVHPFEFDFYLCSHHGSLGTSKSTHYHVLYDDHGFTSDQLQKLIYDMCFTMARCTKPVSLVTPVYYADLVAYRGRLYYESFMERQSQSRASSSSSSLTRSFASTVSLRGSFSKLHSDLENEMFFI